MLAFEFFRKYLGNSAGLGKVAGFTSTAYTCGWWLPYRDLVLVSSRPVVLNPRSVRYSDGFEVSL